MKKSMVLLFLSFFVGTLMFAQTSTVKIHTSAVCSMCKETLEKDLSFEKGVKSAVLDLETKDLTVVYDSTKSSAMKIRQRVSKIGYDADEIKRDPKGYKRLPDCCKKDGCQH